MIAISFNGSFGFTRGAAPLPSPSLPYRTSNRIRVEGSARRPAQEKAADATMRRVTGKLVWEWLTEPFPIGGHRENIAGLVDRTGAFCRARAGDFLSAN